ncbi:ECF transporter S component [Fructobacillus ficulneus]|uniref:Substrate-specific component PdxU2 of predicted pyridoxin-related ECF transporter n=1 Tax=Fructobacillus ficulneus TaxID=157463 RepID=A0A0K8MFI2_9LACO|nr:ECF transporter S component [Fructobacillus ficulneus]GAO99270.1 substrate-specific component PdxU2 of predicted pyridoxin-related ECF transporter [Fructobacillus ficulneus]
MNKYFTTKTITTLAVITALNLALSYVVHIPTPGGYVNLVEAGIFLVALLGSARSGMIVGGLSGMLLDLLAGYAAWAPFSLIIHGLEGYIAGLIGAKKSVAAQTVAVILASLVMVVGYFFATALLSKSWATGWASIIGNIAQCVFGLIIALVVRPALANRVTLN